MTPRHNRHRLGGKPFKLHVRVHLGIAMQEEGERSQFPQGKIRANWIHVFRMYYLVKTQLISLVMKAKTKIYVNIFICSLIPIYAYIGT